MRFSFLFLQTVLAVVPPTETLLVVEYQPIYVSVVDYAFHQDVCACLGFISFLCLVFMCYRCQQRPPPQVHYGTIVNPPSDVKIEKISV